MNGAWALVAATILGIDVGWQPLPDGGFEYIIQLEPQTLESLRDGQDLSSELPPFLQGVRTYRLTVGNEPLPHQGEPPPVPRAAAVAKVPTPDPGDVAYQPLPPSAQTPVDPRYSAPQSNPRYAPTPADPRYAPTPADPRYAPSNAAGARQPMSGGNTATTPSASQPGLLRGLPPPPADPSVPPIESTSEPPPSEPSSPTTRPSLETNLNSPAPRSSNSPASGSPGATNDPAAAERGNAPGSSNVDFSFPGSPPSIRTPTKNDAPPQATLPPPLEAAAKAPPANPPAAGAERKEAKETDSKDTGARDSGATTATTVESKPWLPLIGTMLALFASVGANIYLGWNTLDLRNRYRSLATQLHAG